MAWAGQLARSTYTMVATEQPMRGGAVAWRCGLRSRLLGGRHRPFAARARPRLPDMVGNRCRFQRW
jgi:hypothetical protein